MKITREALKAIVKETMIEESEYQEFFKRALEKAGKSIPSMSDEEKKAFFNKIEKTWKGKGTKKEQVSELTDAQKKLPPKEFRTFKDAEKEVKRLKNTERGIPGGGSSYFVTDKKMNRLKESVNEAKVKRPVNRWLELKNDETMHPHKKMAMGLKELKYQLRETEKFFNWYNKIKTMNELDSDNYWKRTNKHIYKIKERLINIAKTIQEIEK